jgi:hypothetical protein
LRRAGACSIYAAVLAATVAAVLKAAGAHVAAADHRRGSEPRLLISSILEAITESSQFWTPNLSSIPAEPRVHVTRLESEVPGNEDVGASPVSFSEGAANLEVASFEARFIGIFSPIVSRRIVKTESVSSFRLASAEDGGREDPVLARPASKTVSHVLSASLGREVASTARPPLALASKGNAFSTSNARQGATSLTDIDNRTAIYDINAHLVYLPDGRRLEAHSGLGRYLDDARYISVKHQGPTPPNLYRLALRESLFHGVRAIRLIPVGSANMFGRDGMLAHTYMLGPNGQSNGCVSIADYPEFLNAFLRGDINRLVVVEHFDDPSGPAIAAGWLTKTMQNFFKPFGT